ncbi:hypothetical protein [Reticulibacter mediterranei]|uniref:hypothetical protein n=1 Tax=Reticulibacter mediterranei TaxID=2778369 RepID=UPI001C68DB74|nr:hypothetical protein [Reticulibacter mediterranei]
MHLDDFVGFQAVGLAVDLYCCLLAENLDQAGTGDQMATWVRLVELGRKQRIMLVVRLANFDMKIASKAIFARITKSIGSRNNAGTFAL